MNSCLQTLMESRLVILSRGIPQEKLIPALQACADAGVRIYESTFDHTLADPCEENIRKMKAIKRAMGDRMCVGAGTVLNLQEVHAAHEAGAEFVVSPGTDDAVVKEAKRLGMVVIPGAMTPTEIMRAWNLGADMVKVFPADDLGMHYFQNLRGPLGHIPLMATGGVNPATIPVLLGCGVSVVGTGVTVLRRDLIEQEDYAGIGTLARMHVDAVQLCR